MLKSGDDPLDAVVAEILVSTPLSRSQVEPTKFSTTSSVKTCSDCQKSRQPTEVSPSRTWVRNERFIDLRNDALRLSVGDDFVAVIELAKPPNNFFSMDLIGGVAEALEYLDTDERCRSIVLCAEGKHFCAGADFSTGDRISLPKTSTQQL